MGQQIIAIFITIRIFARSHAKKGAAAALCTHHLMVICPLALYARKKKTFYTKKILLVVYKGAAYAVFFPLDNAKMKFKYKEPCQPSICVK